jgi:hypothetical protein
LKLAGADLAGGVVGGVLQGHRDQEDQAEFDDAKQHDAEGQGDDGELDRRGPSPGGGEPQQQGFEGKGAAAHDVLEGVFPASIAKSAESEV